MPEEPTYYTKRQTAKLRRHNTELLKALAVSQAINQNPYSMALDIQEHIDKLYNNSLAAQMTANQIDDEELKKLLLNPITDKDVKRIANKITDKILSRLNRKINDIREKELDADKLRDL